MIIPLLLVSFATAQVAEDCPSGWSRGIDLSGNVDESQTECYVSAGAARVVSCNGDNNQVEMTTMISTEVIANPPEGYVLDKTGLYYTRTFQPAELEATSINNILTLSTQVLLPTARRHAHQMIYIGVNTIVNFVCKYNMGDKTVTKNLSVTGEDVSLNRVAEGFLQYDIVMDGDSDLTIGERARFSIVPVTSDLVYARAKSCSITKQENGIDAEDMSVYLLGEDGNYCTNGFLSFLPTAGFGSRSTQTFEFTAFKWSTDRGSATTEEHALTCVIQISLSPFDPVIPEPCVYDDLGQM